MGLNFQYYDGLQPKIRAGIINEHECIVNQDALGAIQKLPILTTYLPRRGQKEAFFDHLTTSSCPRSF